TEVLRTDDGDFGRVAVVADNQARVEVHFPIRAITTLRANIGVVVIAYACEDVVRSAMLGVKVNGPVLSESSFETAKDRVGVVLLNLSRWIGDRRRRVCIDRKTQLLHDVMSMTVTVTKMQGVVAVDLVIAFDGVGELAVVRRLLLGDRRYSESIGAGAAGNRPGQR